LKIKKSAMRERPQPLAAYYSKGNPVGRNSATAESGLGDHI